METGVVIESTLWQKSAVAIPAGEGDADSSRHSSRTNCWEHFYVSRKNPIYLCSSALGELIGQELKGN